jgi:hypothetical protein
MATRRRPRGYREGGAVSPEPEARADVTPPSRPELPPIPPEDQDAVRRIADATRRAEEMQRQRRAVEDVIDRMPGLTDHKRSFLKKYPRLLEDQNARALSWHYHAGLAAGLADDSPELDAHIISGMRQEEAHRQRPVDAANAAIAAMESPAGEPSVERAAEQLANEAETHRMAMNAEDATPQWLSATLPQAPPTPRARSLPISAPVSRDVPTASGGRVSDRTITLSPEERAVAHAAYHWMTKREAEYEYAKQKHRLAAMRADGSYPMPERN